MDIAVDGTVSVRDGSGAALWQVVTPASVEIAATEETFDLPDAAVTSIDTSAAPPQYAAAVEYAATAANISPALLAALVWQESRWNPAAVSPKGAVGLAQLMPGTARDLGVNPANPIQNLVGGARYLRYLLNEFNGDVERALAAYNAGPGRVHRAGGIPPIRETKAYVASIVQRMSAIPTGVNQ